MRYKLSMTAKDGGSIELPLQHNHLVQATIYRNLSNEYADFLHNEGYVVDKRRFTLFTFSRLLGNYEVNRSKQTIRFKDIIHLYISSPVKQFVHDIAQVFLKEGIRIGHSQLQINSIEMVNPIIEATKMRFESLSPIVAYSTLIRPDGKKYTLYFHPGQSDFERIIIENLKRKAKLIHGEDIVLNPVDFSIIGSTKKHIVKYKNTIIEAYSGRFLLEGDTRLLQMALDTGIGSKGAMGFGMVKEL